MQHRDSVITYWTHQVVLTAALAVPAGLFLILAVQMPPQYQYVVQDAAARGGPLVLAIISSFFYLILTLLLIQSVRYVDRVSIVVAFLTPAAFLGSIFAAGSSTWVSILTATLGGFSLVALFTVARPPWVLRPTPHVSRRYLMFLAIALGVYLLAGIATAINSVAFPRAMGALLILVIFAGTLGILLCLCALKPRIGTLALVYLLIAGIFFGPNDHGVPTVKTNVAAQSLDRAFSAWVDSRADKDAFQKRGKPYPVILVSSEGGGIYAAAHAYGTLSAIQNRCPTFSQHVFATVGVSGGALGNILFVGSLDPRQSKSEGCAPSQQTVAGSPVLADHLSPVLARLLLLETLDRLTPGRLLSRDRAQMLSDSFLDSAPNRVYAQLPVGESFDPASSRPAVISVTVDVATGKRVVLSPIRPENSGTARWWPDGEDPLQKSPPSDQISLIDAAGLSARFPWITPTGRLPLYKGRSILLADGGYFENSGADTVFDMLIALQETDRWEKDQDEQCEKFECYDPNQTGVVGGEKQCHHARAFLVDSFDDTVKWTSCRTPVFIIHFALASREPIENPSVGARQPASEPNQSFITDPLRALLATRKSRGEVALRHMSLELCGTDDAGPSACRIQPDRMMGMYRNNIEPDSWKLPLGWFMSSASFGRILNETAPNHWFDYKTATFDPDNHSDTEKLIYHLDPEAFDSLQEAP